MSGLQMMLLLPRCSLRSRSDGPARGCRTHQPGSHVCRASPEPRQFTSRGASGQSPDEPAQQALDRRAFAEALASDLRTFPLDGDLTSTVRRGNRFAPVFGLNLALASLGETGHWPAALRLLEWMEAQPLRSRERPSEHSYAAFFKGCGPGPSLAAARSVWRRLTAEGDLPPSRVCVALLAVLGRAGEVAEAMDVYRRLTWEAEEPLGASTVNAMLSACARSGSVELALEVWTEVCSQEREEPGEVPGPPDAHSLALVLTACDRGGQWKRGLELLLSPEARRIIWDAPLASCIMAVAGRAGRMDVAHGAWVHCVAQHDAGGPIRLTTWLGNAYLAATAHNGALDQAQAAVDALRSRGVQLDGTSYTALGSTATRCTALAPEERLGRVRAAISALLNAGLQPDAKTLTVLLTALGDAGQSQEAAAAVEDWATRFPLAPNAYVYNALIRCYLRCGQVADALQAFKDLQEARVLPTTVTFTLLLKAAEAAGLTSTVEELRVLRQSLAVAGMLVEQFTDAEEDPSLQPLPAQESFAPGAYWEGKQPPKPARRPSPRNRVRRQDWTSSS